MEQYRDWRLCQLVGPPHTWEDLPAERLDWLLAVDDAVAQARHNVQQDGGSDG
ncbi:hypothetical protein CFP65_3297 [Kitasatospora sp. MMS16-BH015]|uniref:hypothetical protein n=1 Tax=Kitasatospora sp. MMS16-BH015 TaxID=2018025 RepID=UPI000CA20831|nr:hypothetical protein [Kitasatospora sp. MMS16-BH015]AUG78097.1 hypothetical protein CFP65_3297 [Kitasatospora sp. MMS16-BH015]